MQAASAVRGRGGVWLGLTGVIIKKAGGEDEGVTTSPGYLQGFLKMVSTFSNALRHGTSGSIIFLCLVLQS